MSQPEFNYNELDTDGDKDDFGDATDTDGDDLWITNGTEEGIKNMAFTIDTWI